MDKGRWEDATEEALTALAREGNQSAWDCLAQRYRPLIRHLLEPYYLVGAQEEDLVQEGLIGLYEAIRAYDPSRGVKFRTFALLVIRRQAYSAMERAGRLKHLPLNAYVSLQGDEGERSMAELLEDPEGANPLEQLIHLEDLREFQNRIATLLSPLEQSILTLYLEGRSYKEIAEASGRDPKSVDNALQRIRKKLSVKT